MRSEAIEAVGPDSSRVRVEFQWRKDRYGHIISLIDANGAMTPLLESVEGDGNDDWPRSPPLQTLTIEALPDGRRVALLVGMAGRSHWSASIEPVAGEGKIVVDVACRHTKQPTWLGGRYRRLSKVDVARLMIADRGATVSDGGGGIEIAAESIASAGTTRWRFVLSAE